MRLIKQNFEILEQQPGIEGMYKQIELAGRTCYKAEDKITENSAKAFVDRMINSQHFAMLEHGTVYLRIPENDINYHYYLSKYEKNPYSRCNYGLTLNGSPVGDICITSNYRVLVENNWLDDLKYICEPTKSHEKRITVKWTLDRVTGESFLRHRVFSFARESTRYCNYSKNKFGNEITFIIPTWLNLPEGKYTNWDNDWCDVEELKLLHPEVDNLDDAANCFLQSIKNSEYYYFMLLDRGWRPQQARQVLPFSVCSPLVMTGFASDWPHFFDLRCDSHAHPQAREIATALREEFVKRGYLTNMFKDE